jgi:hypothetical protein
MASLESRITALEQTVASLLIAFNNCANVTMVRQANLVLEGEIADLTTEVATLTSKVDALPAT